VQLELHPQRDRIDRPRVKELLNQENELLRAHREEWLGTAARAAARLEYGYIMFECGLPGRVCLALDTLRADGAKLFAGCPTLREVAVFDVQGRAPELRHCTVFDHIDTLEIADWPTELDAGYLFTSTAIMTRPVLRVWTGTNVTESCLNWIPRGVKPVHRVELVQLPPGIDGAVKRFAARFERKYGQPLHVRRPFDVTFALESSHGKNTGRLPDGRPAFLAVQYYEDWAVLVIFDEDGNKVQVRRWKRPAGAEKRAKLRPGIVRMKAFDLPEGIGVSFWDGDHENYFASPFENTEDDDEEWWRSRGGRISGWIDGGDFVVTFGDSGWANRYTGYIHTT
jgi:hypothetical protein